VFRHGGNRLAHSVSGRILLAIPVVCPLAFKRPANTFMPYYLPFTETGMALQQYEQYCFKIKALKPCQIWCKYGNIT
jgi:hypothetical protein